ncbi:S58 family peptidase [SAR202 cluster bacterium AD-802-K11_MRT_200m]|nr:S58 family peptidase [SAR202 cluster bacterium AD-802-K11_MRT_200m]
MTSGQSNSRPRSVDLGIHIGHLCHGPQNSITDVEGVHVGHSTIITGEGRLIPGEGPIRTGVTVVLPHTNNLYRKKIPAACHVLNGFGKSIGLSQISELGHIESPIALTSTLNVWNVADALVEHLSDLNNGVQSFNPIVLESNDRFLNDAIGRHVKKQHVNDAISSASTPNIQEGNIGAGTGMTGFGWKSGIGTSSRICESLHGDYTVGVLVLCNMGDPRDLRIDGMQIGRYLMPPGVNDESGGSISFVVATDAPVTARQLNRMAKRAHLGLARAGGVVSHGSGTTTLAFSNSSDKPQIDDAHLTVLFRGVVESAEEAIINSLLGSETLSGRDGNVRHSIPSERLKNILRVQRDSLKEFSSSDK